MENPEDVNMKAPKGEITPSGGFYLHACLSSHDFSLPPAAVLRGITPTRKKGECHENHKRS